MTNQETIEIIRDIDKAYRTFTKTEIQALEMAIKALEQEPCDKCEVGNPCLYCKYEFEPQERSEED